MQVIDSRTEKFKLPQGQVVTIGNFDGVHLGHQKLLGQAKAQARQIGGGVLAITFDPHPVAVLQPQKKPGVLTPLLLKEVLLERAGVDWLLVIRDNYELLAMSPEQFVREFLCDLLKPHCIFEGNNFSFGYGRSGTIETLASLGRQCGFDVHIVEPQQANFVEDGVRMISSTLVRHYLENGKVAQSVTAMGRPYRLIGPVIRGRGKGRELGFATANMDCPDQVIPAEGVYAGLVLVGNNKEQVAKGDAKIAAAISIGRARTFVGENPLLLEAHILEGPVEDLYGKWMGIDFIRHIRPQQRFESIDKLKSQIAMDCEHIKKILTTDFTDFADFKNTAG